MPYQEPEDFHARKIVPCAYQEYPKLMYSPQGGKPAKVNKKTEEAKLEKDGWSTQPFEGHIQNMDGTFSVPKSSEIVAAR